jgi:hypothetical protein
MLIALVLSPQLVFACAPDRAWGFGKNEGWFKFELLAFSFEGKRPRGYLFVNELGGADYDVSGRIVCMEVREDAAVIAAARRESDTSPRVVFLAVRDLSGTDLGPDRAAPAFTIVPTGVPLAGLCDENFFLIGQTEPLDIGGVRVRDR